MLLRSRRWQYYQFVFFRSWKSASKRRRRRRKLSSSSLVMSFESRRRRRRFRESRFHRKCFRASAVFRLCSALMDRHRVRATKGIRVATPFITSADTSPPPNRPPPYPTSPPTVPDTVVRNVFTSRESENQYVCLQTIGSCTHRRACVILFDGGRIWTSPVSKLGTPK